MISKLLTKVASGIMTVGMPGNTRRIDYAGTRDSKSAPAPAAPKPAHKPAPAKANNAQPVASPAKPTPKPTKATTAPLTLTLPGQYDPIMPIPNGFSMPSEGVDLSLPTKALEPQPMLSVRDGKLINAPVAAPVAAPVVPPAPKPADKPVAAPAVATPRQLNINDITEEDMRKYRKYTGASDMNSEMDRWKTLQAMQGNMNASNRDYRMAKRRGEIK